MTSRLELWSRKERLAFLPAASSICIREVLDGEYFITFRYPKLNGDDERYDQLEIGNEIRLPTDVERGQRFLIWKTVEKQDTSGSYLEVEAHHIFFDLGRYFHDEFIEFSAGQTIETMLNKLFRDSPFSFNISGSFGVRDIFDWGEKSKLALLHELRDIFGAELSFDNYTVTFATRKGGASGKQIRYRKNMKSIRRTVLDNDRITRLFGYGQNGLTIEGYGGRTKKYIDSTYYDPSRPYQGKMEWSEIDNQAELLAAMEKYLAENELPKESYEVETLKLGAINVGDDVAILNEKLSYDLTARVYEYERYPFDHTKPPRFIIGNYRDRFVSDYLLQYRRKQQAFASMTQRWQTQLQFEQSELQKAQVDLEGYINGAFQDGVISQAEAKAIGEHLRQLSKEKADVDAEYTKIYGSAYLSDVTAKTALAAAKTAYDTSYSTCVTTINNAISDGTITPIEKAAVGNSFSALSQKQHLLRLAFEDAITAITAKSEANAKGYANSLYAQVQGEVEELVSWQNLFESYIEGAFQDGVISQAEAKAIGEHKLQLNKEKADVDTEYDRIYSSAYLTNLTLKNALGAAKVAYNTSFASLISTINSVISDFKVTPAERAEVNARFTDLSLKLATLRQAFEDAWASITQAGLNAIAGKGIHSGGIIKLENRIPNIQKTLLTATVNVGASTIPVVSTDGFPASGTAYINDHTAPNYGEALRFTYTGKTATSFTGVSGITIKFLSSGSVFLWNRPRADVVVTAAEVILPDGTYKNIPETRISAHNLGANAGDYDGWEFRYLYFDQEGKVQIVAAGTSGGWRIYPPNPPSGCIRIGYMLVGYGTEDPNDQLNDNKDYDANGYPNFKERIYFDVRYRDERSIRTEDGDVAFGGTPYGARSLSVSVGPKAYRTYYIPIGKGRRSLNLSISLDGDTEYDNFNYGAQLTIGRKAANNADGLGRSLWATYVDADNVRGHVSGQRNTTPYGVHVLSPRVWARSYTMLYDADLMPDPSDGSVIALKLTFYNYHSSVTESFNLRLNWHAL